MIIENLDILEWSKQYRGEKFHALFCDAPYELNFMGKSWDSSGVAFNLDTWSALAEHLLPGAFLFVFAGTLNDDLISVTMRQAGLRKFHKTINWGYGSGFPKGVRIDTVIDKKQGVSREVTGINKNTRPAHRKNSRGFDKMIGNTKVTLVNTVPATPLAKTWAGHRYGLQALKPAAETILIFQKPYDGKAVDSIVKNGAGALNVDGGRIKANDFAPKDRVGAAKLMEDRPWQDRQAKDGRPRIVEGNTLGRWPANLLLQHSPDCNGKCASDCAIAALDEQTGNRRSAGLYPTTYIKQDNNNIYQKGVGNTQGKLYEDTGGASRFFFNSDWSHEIQEQIENADAVRYQAKASRRERNSGLSKPNNHPTVKPIALCKYLATLLLAPAEYAPRRILIPFSGSGSEAIGAMLAGWEEVVAVEKEKEYCEIGKARVEYWEKHCIAQTSQKSIWHEHL